MPAPSSSAVPDRSIPNPAGERRFRPPERRSFLRVLYIGRAGLAAIVLVRAALVRLAAPEIAWPAMLVVLLAYAVAGYGIYATFVRRSRGPLAFLQTQAAMDLLLVTTLVHFEGPQQSGWAALYVLVIAVYALIMPLRSGIVTALLGAAMFLADAYFGHPGPPGGWLWGQVAVFTVVFVVVAVLGQRLRTASVEQTELASELRRVRLEADEILRNISSGVITVDGQGHLAFMNLAAEHVIGLSAAEHVGLPVLDALEARAPELWAAIVLGIEKGRRVNRAEGTARRADGREVPIGASTTTFDQPTERHTRVTSI